MGLISDFFEEMSENYHEWRAERNRKIADFWDNIADESPFGGGLSGFIRDCHEKIADVHDQGGLRKIFMREVLGIVPVNHRINEQVAINELENKIKDNLIAGNYNTVNLNLTAEVKDIQYQANRTNIGFLITDNENEECKVGLSTSYGTDLEVGDVLELSL